MRRFAIIVGLVGCASDDAPTAPPQHATTSPRDEYRQAAHAMLKAQCGGCHEGTTPAAVAAALAVFDLDRPDWPDRFDDRRFAAALHRLASKPAAATATFIAFRDSELAARRR